MKIDLVKNEDYEIKEYDLLSSEQVIKNRLKGMLKKKSESISSNLEQYMLD